MNESLIQYARSLRLDHYPTPDYQVCRDIPDVISYLTTSESPNPTVTIDTEQTPDGLNYCYTFSHTPGTARLIYEFAGLNHFSSPLTYFLSWLDDSPSTIVFHNYLHDVKYFPYPLKRPFADTMLMAYELCLGGGGDDDDEQGMAGRGSLGLKQLSYRHLNMKMDSFKDTVYPYSIPKLHSFLREFLELTVPPVFTKTCICGHPQHRGSCKVPGCTPHRAKLKENPKPTDEDKQINLLRRKITTLIEGVKPDPWKLIKGWHNHDHDYLTIPGIMPVASIADVPEPILLNYACRDADATLRLYLFLSKMMQPDAPFWLFW